jgi:RHS repeat-associated protein
LRQASNAVGHIKFVALSEVERPSDSGGEEGELKQGSSASFDAEYDSAGNQTQVAESDGSVVRHAYDATRQLIAEERTGSRAYKAEYTYDALGNRLMMARNGAVTRYDYDAATPYRFGGLYGYYSDDDDMVYVRARHYSTAHGRWISRDPLGSRGGDWNLHRYVGNRAVSEVDASGTHTAACCAMVNSRDGRHWGNSGVMDIRKQ